MTGIDIDSEPQTSNRGRQGWGDKVRLAFCALLAAVSYTFASGAEPVAGERRAVSEISLAEIQLRVSAGDVPIIDARPTEQYAAGHLPGAIHLEPGPRFFEDHRKLEKTLGQHRDKLVIIYCGERWCEVSHNLWLQLVAQGYKQVVRFSGGWAEWKQAGLPVETSP